MNKIDRNNIAYASFYFIPEPKENAYKIEALKKEKGVIVGYKLSNNTIVSKEDAVMMAKKGLIAGVGIAHNKNTEYLRSLPDGKSDNDLSSLPTI